ncbi:MAG: hypothetical protein GX996_10470 [Firmicutes bacterium]|nr:hypothetical protein [Bacillota bacterium]
MSDSRRRVLMAFVSGRELGYNNEQTSSHENDIKEGGNKGMGKVIDRIMSVQLPPHQLNELGMEKDWQKNVSPSFTKRVAKTAQRYEKALRELSKR